MRGLGCKDCGPFGVFRTIPHGEPFAVKRVEPGIAVPGFIEMDTVNTLSKELFNLDRMITETIIG